MLVFKGVDNKVIETYADYLPVRACIRDVCIARCPEGKSGSIWYNWELIPQFRRDFPKAAKNETMVQAAIATAFLQGVTLDMAMDEEE